jgi:signal recognition particle subunit SRP68
VLSEVDSVPESSPRDVVVTKKDARSLNELLSRELQRSRALVDISNVKTPSASSSQRPLIERLAEYPEGEINLENIVQYPPKAEPVPVKPIFLDVAWNYIDYTDKREKLSEKAPGKAEESAKPQKRGWFGFGR